MDACDETGKLTREEIARLASKLNTLRDRCDADTILGEVDSRFGGRVMVAVAREMARQACYDVCIEH